MERIKSVGEKLEESKRLQTLSNGEVAEATQILVDAGGDTKNAEIVALARRGKKNNG